jgi:hypothetical protein
MESGYQTVGGFPSSPDVPLFGTAERSSGVRFQNIISTVGIPFKNNFQNEIHDHYFKFQQLVVISLQIVHVINQTHSPAHFHAAYLRGCDVCVSHLQSLCICSWSIACCHTIHNAKYSSYKKYHIFRQNIPDAHGPNRKKI